MHDLRPAPDPAAQASDRAVEPDADERRVRGLGRVILCGTGIDAQALAAALVRWPGTQIVGALCGGEGQSGQSGQLGQLGQLGQSGLRGPAELSGLPGPADLPGPRDPAGQRGASDRSNPFLRRLASPLPIAPLRDAADFIAATRPDSAILAMPGQSGPALAEFAARLSRAGIATFAAPRYSALLDPAGIADRIYPLCPRASQGRGLPGIGHGRGFAGETVLVTGSGGTIGLELCRQLLAHAPRRIVLYDQGEYVLDNALRELRALAGGTEIEITASLGSIGDGPLIGRIIRRFGVDSILHAAAYKHVTVGEDQPEAVFRNNTLGTATLARRARDEGVGRFVLVSTDKAVRPSGVMGASKRMAEIVVQDLAAQHSETVFSIVRFGNVIGSSGSVVERFMEQIAFGGPVTLTDAEATRYFMTAEDAAGLVLSAARIARGGEIYVLDMGRPHRIADIAKALIAASGRTDIPIITMGLRPGEKLHEELSIAPGERVADVGPATRIFRACEPFPPPQSVAAMLRELSKAVDAGAVPALMQLARCWVGDAGVPACARPGRLAGTEPDRDPPVNVKVSVDLSGRGRAAPWLSCAGVAES
jgi:FlaA1/EpsC-like NDP-sugar epimerase